MKEIESINDNNKKTQLTLFNFFFMKKEPFAEKQFHLFQRKRKG